MANTNQKEMDVLDKFTEHLKKSLLAAQNMAASLGFEEINPLHLLYGLTALKGSISRELLAKAGVEQRGLQEIIVRLERPEWLDGKAQMEIERERSLNAELPNLGPDARKVIEKAVIVAADTKHRYIGSEHLLLAMLSNMQPALLERVGLPAQRVAMLKDQLTIILKSSNRFNELAEGGSDQPEGDPSMMGQLGDEQDYDAKNLSTLYLLATELTDPNVQAGIDPVIGRDEEIERLVHVLSRRRKNNPVLLGDAGVGKTAIVEGLAKKILEGDVPSGLRHQRIFSLDVGLLIAGTSFRGEFEQRLKQLLDEVKQHDDIILFIDELHTIVGAGGSNNGLDMANLLKPSLARGEIRCIGATTLEEYRKTIENDAAMERRFQPIVVNEPDAETAKKILNGIKKNYEAYHRVAITADAVDAAVEWSMRYVHDRFLPDKAIDLIDEAAAGIKVAAGAQPEELQLEKMEDEIDAILQKKQEAVIAEKYEKAMELWHQEQTMREKIRQARETLDNANLPPLGTVTRERVARVVERLSGVPAADLAKEDKVKLNKLEEELRANVIGQDEAVGKVARAIRLARLGIGDPNRPQGSFLFLGPSGVGKTELAKQIARLVFGDPKALIRVDMSEYAESFNVSKMIGAPAGYVGYKESGKLTEAVRRRPYSVVLFDEVEKAHPDIFNVFLQVLDEGHLTDGSGKTVNFKNCVIIFTSNIGLELLNQQSGLGFNFEGEETGKNASAKKKEKAALRQSFDEAKKRVTKELERFFRLEFLNRLDHVVIFNPLEREELRKIAKIQVKDVERRLERYRLKLMLSPQASDFIVEKGFNQEKGARAIKQFVKETVENKIADLLLNDKVKSGQTLKITVDKDALKIT